MFPLTGTNSSFLVQIIFVFLLLLLGRRPRTAFNREYRIINNWTRENGMKLLDCQRRQFFGGPLFWTSSDNRPVYRIGVKDREGRVVVGWLRLGGSILGMLSKDVQVLWIPDQSQSHGFPVIFPADENERR